LSNFTQHFSLTKELAASDHSHLALHIRYSCYWGQSR